MPIRGSLSRSACSPKSTSEEVAQLVRTAVDRFGKPTHFVTDRGAQFTGSAFAGTLRDLGTKQRFGAIGKTGSIAIIERLWRTLKDTLELRVVPPLSRFHLDERIGLGLLHYAGFRHQGLGGATPAEIYLAWSPPAATPFCHRVPDPPLQLRPSSRSKWYLDREQRLPFLTPNKLAA